MVTTDTDRQATLLTTLKQRAKSIKAHDLAPFVSAYFRAGVSLAGYGNMGADGGHSDTLAEAVFRFCL